jgi:uncharacterized protein (DUF4415 family)
MATRSVSSARGARAAANARRTRREIDYSDLPEASQDQLKAMRRVGRPPLGTEPRQMIAIRIDSGVLEGVRKEARRRGVGYQTLVNEVLADFIRREVGEYFDAPSRRGNLANAGLTLRRNLARPAE